MSKPRIAKSLTDLYDKISGGVKDDTPLEEKLMIFDRGLKLEALKARLKDEQYGKDFDLEGDDEDDT